MNSNLKLLSAGLLVAALAGCGGGGGEMTEPEPTPEETCRDGGGIFEDGECKSADDLREEGADDAQNEEDAAAATKAAVAHYNLLGSGTTGVPAAVASAPTEFTTAKAADKSSQYTRLQGAKFSATNLGLTADGTLTGYYTLAAGDLANAKADVFGGISQKTHDANATDGNRNDFVTAGTYSGVSGMLRCEGATCASQNGVPSVGDWHFKPNNAEDRATGPKIEWGWWLSRTAGDVTAVNRFRPDGTHASLEASDGLEDLGSGTASYEGDAAGRYAVVGDSGAFEATASLTATFGDAEIPLSGSIHTFTGADGESRDWMVELKAIADATTSGEGDYEDGTTVWSGNELADAWNANMLNGNGTTAPNLILGDFSAASQGGRMTGVFGAELQE